MSNSKEHDRKAYREYINENPEIRKKKIENVGERIEKEFERNKIFREQIEKTKRELLKKQQENQNIKKQEFKQTKTIEEKIKIRKDLIDINEFINNFNMLDDKEKEIYFFEIKAKALKKQIL